MMKDTSLVIRIPCSLFDIYFPCKCLPKNSFPQLNVKEFGSAGWRRKHLLSLRLDPS